MAVELHVNGFYNILFLDKETGEEVSKELEILILKNLQNGSYLFNMNTKKIISLNGFNHLYDIELDPTDCLNYEFSEL